MTETNRAPKGERLRDVCEGEGEECSLINIQIEIDGHKIEVFKGDTILKAAKKLGIKIPTLCYHDDLCIAGICRICVVEVEGFDVLQAACSYSVESPIKIKTHSRKIRKARRNILQLMLADHIGDCYTCIRNKNCELQDLAQEYGVENYIYGHKTESETSIDNSSFSIVRDNNKCIKCRRCVRTCIDLQEVGVYGVIDRGNNIEIGTFDNKKMEDVICINCGQCINRCPTGALSEKSNVEDVWKAIDDSEKYVIIQTAPAPRASIGEEFGLEPGFSLTYEMNTALRHCGFNAIFDTCFSADLTIIEEGTELLKRLKSLLFDGKKQSFPMFTSCSPGWVKYLEHFYPEFTDNLSSAKSPQQMFGALMKTYYAKKKKINPENIVTVALMPCTAKKFEANREEMKASGYQDVDYGITTRELARMFREAGIDLPKMEKSKFDDPFGTESGSGVIFGATGGVMESAIRTLYDLVTGKKIEDVFENANIEVFRGFEDVKYTEIKIEEVGSVPDILKNSFENFDFLKGQTLKLAVCHGTASAKRVLENIKDKGIFSECHFIEVMACPGGCLGGGGQSIPTSKKIRELRAEAIYTEDLNSVVRKSYENTAVNHLYTNFLDYPGSEKSHKLLHTKYLKRGNKML